MTGLLELKERIARFTGNMKYILHQLSDLLLHLQHL